MVTSASRMRPLEGWEIPLPESGVPDIIGVTSTAIGESYDALFGSALALQKEGNYREAIAHYTRAIDMEPREAGAYINRGAAYESTGDLDLALQDLNIALGMGPRSEAYHIRGHVYFRKGDFGQAVLDFSEVIRLDSGNANAYIADAFTYRGHSYRHMSCYDHAIRDYRKALALAPSNANSYVNIGVIHSLLGDHDLALQCYDKALNLNPNSAYIHLERGGSYSQAGALDRAIEEYGKALALDPNYVYAYVLRGVVFQKNGDSGRAVQDWDRVLELKSNYDAYVHTLRGALYLEEGNLDRAIQDFDTSVALGLEYTDTYNNRGVAYERKGDLDRAMQDYNKALDLRPNKEAYFNRGVRLLQTKEWEQARSDLLSAGNMGMNLVAAFGSGYGSVAEFEEKYNVELPQDVAETLSVEEEIPADAGASILAMFRESRESTPESAFDALPSDGAKNYKHYVYGWPKK